MTEPKTALPEPWLRGTLTEIPPVPRAVLHALELAKEDLWKWCFPLSNDQLNQSSAQIASIAFHLRHIARSIDRLLTYAENRALTESQLALLRSELSVEANHEELFSELEIAFEQGGRRIRELAHLDLESPRHVGKKQLPTTLGGLLVHAADHTLRHVGQAITTAKFIEQR
jgi:uncharacterized damage-inducible protein DinB